MTNYSTPRQGAPSVTDSASASAAPGPSSAAPPAAFAAASAPALLVCQSYELPVKLYFCTIMAKARDTQHCSKITELENSNYSSNTHPNDTKASAAVRSGRACVAQSGGRRERASLAACGSARSSLLVGHSKPETIARRNKPPSELSRSHSRHNYGAAGGGHPVIELPWTSFKMPWGQN